MALNVCDNGYNTLTTNVCDHPNSTEVLGRQPLVYTFISISDLLTNVATNKVF